MISVMAGEGLPVEVACRVLSVSCAGFYAWFRPPSARAVRHAWLADLIREVHAASYGTYGAKRVYAELVLGRTIRVGHNAVAMLMRRAGIQGRTGSPKRRGLPGVPTADDLVDRVFIREGPNQLWGTDLRGQGLLRGRARRLQPPCRWLVDQPSPDRRADREALGMAVEQRDAQRGKPCSIATTGRSPVHFLGVHRPRPPLRAPVLNGVSRGLL